MGVTLEICVDSIGLARAAARGGADRIELCGPLLDGGITASAGLAIAARNTIDLPIALLVRPRTGAFTVSEAEFEVMQRDILFAQQIGVDIVVLGILREDHTVDVERTRTLIELASPMQVTFHRAFDQTPNLRQALDDVLRTGATRILTSGGRQSVTQGATVVGDLLHAADSQIGLLLCGGISSANIQQALIDSGVHEVHGALRSEVHADPVTRINSQADLEHFSESVTQLRKQIDLAKKVT